MYYLKEKSMDQKAKMKKRTSRPDIIFVACTLQFRVRHRTFLPHYQSKKYEYEDDIDIKLLKRRSIFRQKQSSFNVVHEKA